MTKGGETEELLGNTYVNESNQSKGFVKSLLCSLATCIITSLIFGLMIYYLTTIPPNFNFMNVTKGYNIEFPNETIEIDTDTILNCGQSDTSICDPMYNLLFIINYVEPFSVTSTYDYTHSKLIYNNGTYSMNVSYPYGNQQIDYFSMIVRIYSNQSLKYSQKLVVNTEYNYYGKSLIAIMFSLPILLAIFVIIYTLVTSIRYCHIIRKNILLSDNNRTIFTL